MRTKAGPLSKSGVAIDLEIGGLVKISLQVEMVLDGSMDGKLLQTSQSRKPDIARSRCRNGR